MAEIAAPAPRRGANLHPPLAVLALGGTAVLVRLAGGGGFPGVQNFLLVFGSLLIEAMPFILLGASVSALIEVFVPARWFERLAALPGPLQLPASGLAGMAFPVCECGSVPVARRLATKGLSPAAATTFMLAAPIINPVVLASTFIAYRGRGTLWPVLLGRAGLGLVVAMAVGWVVARHSPAEFLKARVGGSDEAAPPPESRVGGSSEPAPPPESRGAAFFAHLTGDFVFMGRYLVLGAAVAAGLQTFVPQSVVGAVAGTPVVDLLAMMALAFLLSLCSESDAFVAASFVQFGVGAQLAFLVFGPMVDTKLGFLYAGTFRRGFLGTVVIVVAAVTLAGCLWIEVFFG